MRSRRTSEVAQDPLPIWTPDEGAMLELGRDAGGDRYFLDGEPLHNGTALEVLTTTDEVFDDDGRLVWARPVWVPVRFETARVIESPGPSAVLYIGTWPFSAPVVLSARPANGRDMQPVLERTRRAPGAPGGRPVAATVDGYHGPVCRQVGR